MSRKLPFPKVVDDDEFTIAATLNGKILRFWHYDNPDERRKYMMYASEYVQGWIDGAPDVNLDFHSEFERLRDQMSRLLDMLGGKDA